MSKAKTSQPDERRNAYAGECAHELFEAQAGKTPHATALRYKGRTMTYGELNTRSNQLAHYLKKRNVGPETLVGLCFDLSIDAVMTVIGILKAGGGYVALDPSYPLHRLQSIVDHAGVSVVLTTTELAKRTPQTGSQPICLDGAESNLANENPGPLRSGAGLDNIAYVTYTSGSTGAPKGVIAVHGSITNGLNAVPFEKDRRDEVCCLNNSLSFGFSVSRLFLPLLCGLPLVIIPEKEAKDPETFVRILEAENVTSVAMVTSLFREILKAGPRLTSHLKSIRTLAIGGSVVTPDIIENFVRAMPHTTLLNGYASSEIGGAAFVWTVRATAGAVSTGRPFPNTQIYILNENGASVSPGMVGEIYVSAPHLARGYLGDPVLTSERFLPNPFTDGLGDRLYRTGDLARALPDGDIEVLGRVDQMVKVRDVRIELGEIEAALLSSEDVRDAAVAVHDMADDKRLVAYVVNRSGKSLNESTLRQHLSNRLPDSMMPSFFVFVDSLPLTSTGKLNRAALLPPEAIRPDLAAAYVAPRHEWEQKVAEIWSHVLGIEPIGIHDNFFELGGHSLLAVQIVLQIEDQLGVDLPPESLLRYPTIATLSQEFFTPDESNTTR
jgi:amino acid adenylation domain-containing protein